MRLLPLTASFILTFGLIHPVSTLVSVSSEDSDGSGYDLDSSGSGSGDDSVPDKTDVITVKSDSKDVRVLGGNAEGGKEKTFHGSSDSTFDRTNWPTEDSEFIFIESSRRFWEDYDVRAALITGGVTGAVIAAMLMAILIYQMKKKDEEGAILSRKKASDERNREVII